MKPLKAERVKHTDRSMEQEIRSYESGLKDHGFLDTFLGIGRSETQSLRDLEQLYSGEKDAMFIVSAGDDPVGFLALRMTDDGAAVIEHLRFEKYDPEIVRELLRKAFAHLRDKGVSEVVVRVSEKLEDIEHILGEFNFTRRDASGGMRTLRAHI